MGNLLLTPEGKLYILDLGPGDMACCGTPPFRSLNRQYGEHPLACSDDVYSILALMCVFLGGLEFSKVQKLAKLSPMESAQQLYRALILRLGDEMQSEWGKSFDDLLTRGLSLASRPSPSLVEVEGALSVFKDGPGLDIQRRIEDRITDLQRVLACKKIGHHSQKVRPPFAKRSATPDWVLM